VLPQICPGVYAQLHGAPGGLFLNNPISNQHALWLRACMTSLASNSSSFHNFLPIKSIAKCKTSTSSKNISPAHLHGKGSGEAREVLFVKSSWKINREHEKRFTYFLVYLSKVPLSVIYIFRNSSCNPGTKTCGSEFLARLEVPINSLHLFPSTLTPIFDSFTFTKICCGILLMGII
jgi:hypothetical protein